MSTSAFMPRTTRSGFTLIELLTVIAIIAVLAAIMVPTVSTAIAHVKKARTTVLLANLVGMSRMYKNTYQYWPTFATPQTQSDTPFSLDENSPRFVRVMMGYPAGPDIAWNKFKIPFANFGESDLTPDPETVTPVDSFGNTDLYLIFSTNLATPGRISPSVISGVTMISKEEQNIGVQQSATTDVYSDCVGMSPGPGLTDNDAITTFTVTPPGE